MSSKFRSGLYLILFVLSGIIGGGCYRIGLVAIGVMQCPVNDEADAFLANCTSKAFGDYEHGAYYFDLEPKAIAYLRQADVLFLGNSRAQFAFSSDSVGAYFAHAAASHYVLAFTAEESSFAQALIERERLSPKVLVIVADPFFSRYWLSPSAMTVMGRGHSFWQQLSVWQEYVKKKALSRIKSRVICELGELVCPRNTWGLYRSSRDGAWLWRGAAAGAGIRFDELPQIPINLSQRKNYDKANAAADQGYAAEFLKSANIGAECVVLTVVPNSEIDADDYAREMGRLLGANTVLPQLEGLSTIDGSHLSWASAQLWSDALVRMIDPIIRRCAPAPTAFREDAPAP